MRREEPGQQDDRDETEPGREGEASRRARRANHGCAGDAPEVGRLGLGGGRRGGEHRPVDARGRNPPGSVPGCASIADVPQVLGEGAAVGVADRGSLARARAITSSTSAGSPGSDARAAAGPCWMMRARIAGTLRPSKARLTGQQQVQHGSEREDVAATRPPRRPAPAPATCRRACRRTRRRVVRCEAGTLAIPKSMIFGSPEASTMMLAGLMSRCTTPRAWA